VPKAAVAKVVEVIESRRYQPWLRVGAAHVTAVSTYAFGANPPQARIKARLGKSEAIGFKDERDVNSHAADMRLRTSRVIDALSGAP
jgi:hypothetical protein